MDLTDEPDPLTQPDSGHGTTKGTQGGTDVHGSREKMNPKKRKRLENYIKKKLAKEEKAELISKLAKTSFTSDLMQSSRSLGKARMTNRERLRLAINQQKAGFHFGPLGPPTRREGGKVQLPLGNAAKPASNLSAIPLKAKKKSTMVSVKELLKRVRPGAAAVEDETGTDSFDSSASEGEDETEKPGDLEKAPTTSLEYLQAPSRPPPKVSIKPPMLPKCEPGPKKFYVPVSRSEEIAAARLLLPVYGEEQAIMECLAQNDVMIICGETGSGKTTQVPQFLYEAGYGHPESPHPGMVGITQPRRVAAVSMASRVGTELGDGAPYVSYQIRYDATTSKDTRLKFMTDGVLLREMALDFLLTKYSVLIIDEAHERTLNTDLLIGSLTRIVRLRNRLVVEGKPEAKVGIPVRWPIGQAGFTLGTELIFRFSLLS
ncbi:putative ATP-dependent RNA helicase DHR1 [Massospora cicadina]|nr:putative ATP-dependent RNA helicase DHR1 [Massospora cicadina]